MLLTVTYEVLSIPFLMAFEDSEGEVSVALDLLCFVLFVLDICVNFNMGFYTRGSLCEDRVAIARRYLRSWFALDVLSTFPFNWLFQSPVDTSSPRYNIPVLLRLAKISRLMRSFRLLRLVKLGKYFIDLRQFFGSESGLIMTLLSLLTLTGLLAHWAACGFYLISQVPGESNTWLRSVRMEEANNKDKYVMALYWAVTTLTTTGFGDVVPVNTYERLYGITLMMLSAGVFSLLLGKVGVVLAGVGKAANEQRELMLAVSRYLKSAAVPDSVRLRALHYLDYKWTTRKRRKALNPSILAEFSEPLRSEISQHIFGTILSRAPFLTKFEYIFTCQLATHLQAEIYAVHDSIFSEEIASTDMYFLEKGNVEVFHAGTGMIYAVLHAGDCFGELSFITNCNRTASARCSQYAEVLTLSRSAFTSLIALSPAAQYSLQLVTGALEAGDLFSLGILCYLCREYTHVARDCYNCRVDVQRNEIKARWLEKKKRERLVPKDLPKYPRRRRQVNRAKGYSLRNVKSLPKRSVPQVIITRNSSDSDSLPGSPAPCNTPSPFLSLSPTGTGSPFSPSGRRFSVFRGIKTYSLQSWSNGLIGRGSDLSPRGCK